MKVTVIAVERGGNPAAPIYKTTAESAPTKEPAIRVEMIDTAKPTLTVGDETEVDLGALTGGAS